MVSSGKHADGWRPAGLKLDQSYNATNATGPSLRLSSSTALLNEIMSRKTNIVSFAVIAVTLSMTFAGAGSSGAFAQQGESVDNPQLSLTEERVPVFVSEEVAQPLPDSSDNQQDSDGDKLRAGSLKKLIAKVPTPDQISPEMECLAGAIYFESRGEPAAGQLAVAQVVVNRAGSGLFPSDYCGVVYQRSQFSFVKNGRMPTIKRNTIAWKRAKKIARIAHEGLWDSNAGDALYFHAKYVRPSWSRRKQALATIDTHIFYR